jgi:Flp pilus assembly protein TadB
MEQLINQIAELAGPISRSNIAFLLLAGAALALLGVLFFASSIENSLLRAGRSSQNRLTTRLGRAVRQLRQPERSITENLVATLYRDGSRDGPILERSDAFLFIQIALAVGVGLVALLAYLFLSATPFVLTAPVAGYLVPMYLAERHNRRRRKAIETALPRVLSKLDMRIASGMQMPTAIRSVLRHIDGPIAGELDWAARQMTLASADSWTVLRDLGDRTGVVEFRTLATIMQRSSRSSAADARKAFSAFVAKVRSQADREKETRLEKLESKVTTIVTPPLLGALMSSAFGSLIIDFINGRGG